ncbi:MAG: aldehyde dehydrogenase family protein [Puniceicoccaceae bacterium]
MEPILLNGQWTASQNPSGSVHAFNPSTKEAITEREYPISSWDDLQAMLDAGKDAADQLAQLEPDRIATFLETYADELGKDIEQLVQIANTETGLPVEPRLKNVELPRTTNQLRQAAVAARDGSWRNAVIDTAAGIRSIHNPLGGPVAVFGPNNFPFAFNGVAGGDFAAAIGAGNPVIAKAHPGHPHTSTLLAKAAMRAVEATGMPKATVQMFYKTKPELGLKLAAHPTLKAVGFTGGRGGGTRLKEAADRVGTPIYLEMSSSNPVFILRGALEDRAEEIAAELHGSCALGAGQFCTKPGLAIVERCPESASFLTALSEHAKSSVPGTLLTPASPDEIDSTVTQLIGEGAELLAGGRIAGTEGFAYENTVLTTTAAQFLRESETMQTEAFGSVCLVVVAEDLQEAVSVASVLEGNLTGTIYSAQDGRDDSGYNAVEKVLRTKVGRLLNDKMPTGVAVSPAMNHGGPFPATGHPLFTSVGIPASLIRFTALHSYDNVRSHRLPSALQDKNPTGSMLRSIDAKWTTEDVS